MTEREKTQTVRKAPVRRKNTRPKTLSALSRSADREAKRLGVAILEVLGGMRTPSEAAEALGVSLPRYYALESRALGGFLAACKKPPRGPRYSPEREIERLERDIERLESEVHARMRFSGSPSVPLGLRSLIARRSKSAMAKSLAGKNPRRVRFASSPS